MRYKSLNLPVYDHYTSMINQTHLLIAGTTGSGKSVLTNNLIHTALVYGPAKYQFIFIDSKGTELNQYSRTYPCIAYANDYNSIEKAIHQARFIMEKRFKEMSTKGMKTYKGPNVILVIDEYIDISINLKLADKAQYKRVNNDLVAILSRGRAAKVHCWICTQRPTSDVITGVIKANIPAQVALHTATDQESRNIIGISDAHYLPAYGQCLYYTPDTMQTTCWPVPLIPESDFRQVIRHWQYYRYNTFEKILYKIGKLIKKGIRR